MDKSVEDIDADFVKMHFDLKDKQDEVQKKTFMKWINSVLVQQEPPSTISDLSEDLRDGVVLLNLLKALTGEALQIEKGDRFGHVQRIHYINNVGNALQFLQDKQVKMVNIHAGDIVDGRSSIIMGLIWTLILHFQIEESTKHICSGMLGESDKLSGWRGKSEPKVVMLKWAQKTITEKYGIEVKDFGASWRNGVAFNALIHDVKPHMIDMRVVETSTPRENLERAFETAEQHLGIPRLLDPEDVDVDKPDEKSIMTYVSKFVQKFPQNLQSCEGSGTKEMVDKLARKIKELDGWVSASIESIQHEEVEDDLQDFGSKLDSQHAVCQYLASEVNKLSQRVPYNFQVAALRDQMRCMMEQFKRAEEIKDAKIKALQDLNSFLEKHENDVKMFEIWKSDGTDILHKLDDIIQGVTSDVSLEDLEIWKDHVTSSCISNILMENLEALDNIKLQLNAHEGLKEQILEAFVSIKEIKENSIYKISMFEYKMEEQNCMKLLETITTDLSEIEDSFKSEEFSHEKSLQALEEESELVLRCQESLDAMTSICGRNFDDSFKHEIEVHLVRLQDLNSKISELTKKIQNGALIYNDYWERKFQVIEWIDRVELQVHQLKEANPELEDYETIHNDFKELMDEIGHQKTNIEESKVLLQNLAFNSAWSSRVDDETNLLCDLIKRLETLCSTSQDAMKEASVFVSCRELKNYISEKIEVVGRNCLLSDAHETWDDIQAIKSMMEQFQTFESSICEVEALMEKGYALLKHADAHKFLAIFLKESFKFCCDLRNIAHEKLATLKNSLELWQSYEGIKIKISGRSVKLSANKSQLSDYLAGMEFLLGELDELGEVILKLSKYISQEKHAELLNDLESLRDNHRKEIDSLNGGIKVEDLLARFEGEVCGLKKFIEDWKTGLCAERLNEDVNMERIPQLVHRTQTLVKELTAEGSSKIHCLGELLEEIKHNEYASEDVINECLCSFELVESSFRGFCIEMEDLHKCTVSDADHLTRCGKTIVEVSQWLQSEKLTVEGFRDISEVEEQLRRALELYSKLECHRNSMVDVESEASLVSERNSISCLVHKLKDELEAFNNNLDSSFHKLNDLVITWQNLLEIKNQITSTVDSISEQIESCKSSLNQFSAGVVNGSLSDTLKIAMLDLQKVADSNRHLKSIAEEMLPRASEEFHQKMCLELTDNEQVHRSLVNEVLAQMDLLHRKREQFENFAADVDDCLHQAELFKHEIEDYDFVKDFVLHDQPSLHLIETFSNKFENLTQFWNHVNDEKKLFVSAMDGDLQEKLLEIGSNIRDTSELMVNTTSFCGCLIEYKELMRCLKVCLAEFEKNLLSGNDNDIDGEILILLEDGKHREELMASTLSTINGLKSKSSDCSLESALEISHLTGRFEDLRKMSTEFRDTASLFETLEEEVQSFCGYLNVGDVASAPETIKVLMEVVKKTEVKNKDHLAVIDRKVMELGGGLISSMTFLERFQHRFDNLRESVDDLHKKLETQHVKEQYLLEKLVTYEGLRNELEKYLIFEPERLITFDDIKIKMSSIQEHHNQLSKYKELLATVNQDIKHFSEDEHLKLFSRIISVCSINFNNDMEKSADIEMKLLNEIENINFLSKHYDGFMEKVAMFDTKIESLTVSIQKLFDEVNRNGDSKTHFQEDLTDLKIEIVSMDTSPECCLLKELCGEGVGLIASHKQRLSDKVLQAQDLIGSLFSNMDQCQERVTEVEDETDALKNKMRIVSESLSCINGEASTNDDNVDAQLMNIEGWMEVTEEIDVLKQKSPTLSIDSPIRDGISPDLVTLKQESSQLNEEMINLQEHLRIENELETTQNRFGEFVSRVEQQLESMRAQNLRSMNEAHQLANDLLLEGEKKEQEGLSSEFASCYGQFIWSWMNQKEELKKFKSLYEEEITRSISLRNQLIELKSWLEKMKDRRSELCSGNATCRQFEYLEKLKDFDSHLEEKVNSVKDVSQLLNSTHFDENVQLLSDGKALVSQFHQLVDSIKEMVEKATKSLEKIEDFQVKENKVKELMTSLKLKLSAVEKNEKLDEQMMEIVDISVDLDVIQALIEQMDDIEFKDLAEIDLRDIQSCMETLKGDLEQINQSQVDVENKLKEKSDLYFEYQAGMKELKKWIEEKEYFLWGLKAGHNERCLIDENFSNEMTTKMRIVEEMKRKMNSLNHEDFEAELDKYLAEIEALIANSFALSALMRDQALAEEEYLNGLVELRNCSHEIAGVLEGNKENNIQILQFADLNNANLLDKLSKMVSCLSKVKFMLESDLGRINESLEMDSMKCLPLSRIHNFEEMEKLAKYLENWILFQDAIEKYCAGLKRTDNDSYDTATTDGTNNVQQYLQKNLCSSPKKHQGTVNLLRTAGQNLEPVNLVTTSHQAKALWDEIYANGRRLVATLMHWTSMFEEVSESWNEFSSVYNEISEFLHLPKRDVETWHLNEVQTPAHCQDRVRSFIFMEGKMTLMMEAVLKVMTFLGGKEVRVKLEADVKGLKEAFEKSRIEADLELKKLSGTVSNSSADAVDGVTLLEENELMEQMKISMIRYDGASPDDDYKAPLCDSSFHDVPSYLSRSRSFGSSVDESPISTEEASTVGMEEEVADGLNDLLELVRNMKTSLTFDCLNLESSVTSMEGYSLFVKPADKQLEVTLSDKMYLLEIPSSSSSSLSSEPNSLSPITRLNSISLCYSNFLIFLSSCLESFSLQPKKFYQQLEDIRYSDEITKNLEYFNVVLPMAVVLRLKKIADWMDPTFQKLKNESFLGRLKTYFNVNSMTSKGIVIEKQEIEASSSILSKQLLRQRKELEVVLKDLDSSKCLIRKINEIFKELNESMYKMPSDGDAFQEHLNGMENSLGKLKKEMEALKSSSGFYAGSDGLSQALFKLLDAKVDEITSEIDRRKKEAGEHSDVVNQHKKGMETLGFKLDLHQTWLSETDKMEFNIENTDIFKLVEHETRSRIHDMFKMRTSLDLMIENQRWRCQQACSMDAGLLCSHIDVEELKHNKPIQADVDNENMQLHSSIACLFKETYTFWKRLRKHQSEKSSVNLLIDSKQLEHFNQLEMAWKNRDVIEDEAHEILSSTVVCYKDILEHLVILKLSVSSIDVSKRRISFTNVQAYVRKFSVVKQELLDLIPAINKFHSSHSLDQSASDLQCLWEVLCCKVLSQIQVLGHFMRQANQIKTKIEEFKEDLSMIECHFYDTQNMHCTSSHLDHYEDMELALKELEKEVLMLLEECQRVMDQHQGHWNIQSLHIEALNVLHGINKFSSDLNVSKLKFIKKLKMWSKFLETSGQMLTRLHALEFSLQRTCKECQLEENICLLRTTFSQELQEINKTLRNLELERVKLSSNDDSLSMCTTFQLTSLRRILEACSSKVFVRLKKLRQVSETILRFDRSLDGFKGWMVAKENEFNSPFKFLNCHFKEILRTTQALRTSQEDIELKSRICSSFFGVCEVLCHDSDACPSLVEQDAVMTTMDLLEHKWNNIVFLALGRKSKLEEVWKHWKKYFADCNAVKNVVTSVKSELAQQRDFENFECLSICSMKEASHFCRKLILSMEGEHQKRDELKENYKQMALSLWVDEAGEMQAELEKLWSDWQETEHSIRLIGRRIGYHLDLFKMFQSSAVSLHEWLVGISASLEQMEKSFEVDPEFNCRKNFKLIKKMKREVRLKLQEFNEVAKSLDVVVDDVEGGVDGNETVNKGEAFNRGAKELLENFSKFQSEILLRIKNMEKKMNRGVREIVENDSNQGSNVDEIESQQPISSHLDKSTEDSSASIVSKSVDWTNDAYSTLQTQILFLLLIAAACLLPVSRIRASDLVRSLTRR